MHKPCDGRNYKESKQQRVRVTAEKFIERINQKVCKGLDHVGACSRGPVSDFLLREMGEY